MRQWFYLQSGQKFGPVEQNELIQMIKDGQLSHQDFIWTDGMPEWGMVEKSPFAKLVQNESAKESNLKKSVSPAPAPAPAPASESFSTKSEKSETQKNPIENGKEQTAKEISISGKSYRHSGIYEPIGFAYVLGIAGGGTILLALIYNLILKNMPFVQFNFLFAWGYAVGSGKLIKIGGKMGKIRDNQILTIAGLVMGTFSLYIAWVIYISMMQGGIVVFPTTLMRHMEMLAEKGSWEFFGSTFTGVELVGIWAIEALLIIVYSALAAQVDEPFCEDCHDWIEARDEISPLAPTKRGELIGKAIQRGDFSLLKEIKRAPDAKSDHTKITMLRCLACNKKHFLTVSSIAMPGKSNGVSRRKETFIVKNLIINQEIFKSLMTNWKDQNSI